MNHYLTPEEAAACQAVQATVKTAREAVDSIFLALASNQPPGGWPDGVLRHTAKACEDAKAALGSLDFHPQSEWRGGDSFDPSNYATRRPEGFRRFGIY